MTVRKMGSHRLCQAINHCRPQTKLCLTLT
nr:MAG TPA: hypothetical protein [Caudoviricetes sp.]DAG49376.1 MAG TPA: hypothetical protein [Caudoviricetes sp.]